MSFFSVEQLRKIQDRALAAEDERERLRARIAELERELERIRTEVFPDHQCNIDYWGKRAEKVPAEVRAHHAAAAAAAAADD